MQEGKKMLGALISLCLGAGASLSNLSEQHPTSSHSLLEGAPANTLTYQVSATEGSQLRLDECLRKERAGPVIAAARKSGRFGAW